MLPIRKFLPKGVAIPAAAVAGLLLCLETSCAPSSGTSGKNQTKTATVAAGGSPGQPGLANGSRPAAVTGQPAGHFVASAKVGGRDATVPEAPSIGQELIAHAIPAASDSAPAARTGDSEESGDVGGGGTRNGVPIALAERRIGTVRVIGAHGKFVLLETTTGYGGVPLDEGQELHCRGSAASGGVQTAVLKVSREREASYLVADVVSGEPQAGDVAYFPIKKQKDVTANARGRKKDQ